MRIHLQKDYAWGAWSVYAIEDTPNGHIPYRLTLERLPQVHEGSRIEPTLRIPMHESDRIINALLNGLAEAGLIPRMGATEAELVATKRHLEDMRAMAFEDVKPQARLT